MSRRGIATRSTRQPASGRLGVDVAGPLDDHDGGEVAGLVEPPPGGHVGDRVGAEHEEQLAAGRRQRLERVGGDRRLAALDLDRRSPRCPSMPSTAVRRQRESVGGRRHDPAALLPRVTGDHEQHAVEAELARVSAATTTWPACTGSNVPPNTPSRSSPSSGGVYGRVVHSPGRNIRVICPRSIVHRERRRRAGHPRPGAGLAPRPTRRARSRRRRASVRSTATSSASTCSSAATTSRSTSSRCVLRDVDRARLLVARDRRGRRRERRRGAHRRPLPRPAPRRARVGRDPLRGASRRRPAPRARRPASSASSSPTGARCCAAPRCSHRRATPRPTRRCSRHWRPAPPRRRVVADGTTGPDDLAVASLPDHGAALLVGRDGHAFRRRERAQLRRARRHRRPHLGVARVTPG